MIARAVMMLFVLACVLVPAGARGDGKAFKGRSFGSLAPLMENEQRALICHKDGTQSMLLAIQLSLQEQEKALWLFPVRGRPEQVKFDLVDKFQEIPGKDVFGEARDTVDAYLAIPTATQVYPLIAFCLLPSLGNARGLSGLDGVEKFGLRAVVLDAESPEDLAAALKRAEAPVPATMLASFAPYKRPEYSIVAVWIKSREEVLKEFPDMEGRTYRSASRHPCIAVTFPTDKPFFPMRATADDSDQRTVVSLFVSGFVDVQTSAPISPRATYRRLTRTVEPTHAFVAEDALKSGAHWTGIRFSASPRAFTDDLVFVPSTPPGIGLAEAVSALSPERAGLWLFVSVGVCLTAALSLASGAIAGKLVFRQATPYAWLGLWCLGTLLVMYLMVRDFRRKVDGERGRRQRTRRRKVCRFICWCSRWCSWPSSA